KAIHFRHHQVEQDHVRLVLLDSVQRLAAVPCLSHGPLWTLEPSQHPLPLDGIVLHHQDAGRPRRGAKAADHATKPLAVDWPAEIAGSAERDAAAVRM